MDNNVNTNLNKIGTIKHKYNIAIIVLAVVLVATTAFVALRPSVWAFFAFPILGAVATVLLWICIARIFLCKNPERLLAKSFTSPLKFAMATPTWLIATIAITAVPSDISAIDADLANAAALIAILFTALLALVLAVVLGAISFFKAYKHIKLTTESETKAYRNGPLWFSIAMIALFLLFIVWAMFIGF